MIRPVWRFPPGRMDWRVRPLPEQRFKLDVRPDVEGVRLRGPVSRIVLYPSVNQEKRVKTKIYWPGVGVTIELVLWTFFGGVIGALLPIATQSLSAGSPIVWKNAAAFAVLTGLAAVYQRFKQVPPPQSKAPPAADTPPTPPPTPPTAN